VTKIVTFWRYTYGHFSLVEPAPVTPPAPFEGICMAVCGALYVWRFGPYARGPIQANRTLHRRGLYAPVAPPDGPPRYTPSRSPALEPSSPILVGSRGRFAAPCPALSQAPPTSPRRAPTAIPSGQIRSARQKLEELRWLTRSTWLRSPLPQRPER
jgi:hypothetical protein